MRKRKFIILIMAILLMLLLIYFKNKNVNISNFNKMETKNSLSNQIQDENEKIEISLNDNIIYNNVLKFKAKIENFNDKNVYNICCELNGISLEKINVKSENAEISCNLTDVEEGKNIIKTSYYVNEKKIGDLSFEIFYIKPYTKQFLDELSNIGFSTHFGYMYSQDNQKDINLLNKMGCFNVRDDIRFNLLNRTNALEWVNMLNENNMKLYAIIMPQLENEFGEDKIVNSDMELDVYKDILKKVIEKIDAKVYKYEMYNEPNWTIYTKENIKWYSKQTEETIKLVNKNKKPSDIIIGSTCASGVADNKISSLGFLNEVEKNNIYKYNVGISYHSYDYYQSLDLKHQELLKKHSNFINEQGGFQNLYVSEYGVDTSNYGKTEKYQAILLIRQTVYNNMKSVKNSYIYSFRDMGFDKNNAENYYGVITHDYKPKPSYYAMKNFLTNTNGAEYIGNLDLAEELEAHVYDKDGKPVVIAWSNNNNKNIEIDYKNFIAKDIYGKEIKANEKGKLVITTSPVYIYNLDYKYYYKAISNVATEKYEEFEEKFSEQISKMPNVQDKIEQMKTYMQNVGKAESKILEETSIKAMKMHYEIGNKILEEYKNKQIEVEPVKISSMLDAIDDIGNSYEDLVTVTAQTREPKLEQTKSKIEKAEEKINNNSEIEIIYPNKILEFSKDYYEKAEYINGLEEENDIKTGLIMSKNLHSELLADWSDIFSQIQIDNYIDKYISDNPVTIEYTETNLTNKDVKATIVTNAQIEITNNNNSKEHTFTKNGEFIFEYTIKGRNKTIKAIVKNIDKQAPQITNIEADKIYIDKVTPKIYDENLNEIKLILNEEEILNYKSGTELKEEGFYELTAIDKAGNETRIQFQIIVNKEDDYKIKDNKIKNIDKKTTKKNFVDKLNLKIPYEIYRNDQKIEENNIICTGDKLVTQTGEEYILIVAGDLNRDGDVNIKDMVKMRIYLLEENNIDEIEKIAADTNIDEKTITIKDFVRMRLIVLM